MKLFGIADLKVALNCQKRTMERAQKYLLDENSSNPDVIIETTPEDDVYYIWLVGEKMDVTSSDGK